MKKERYKKEIIGKVIEEDRVKWLRDRGLKETRRKFIDESGIKALHGGAESEFSETTLLHWEKGHKAPSPEALLMLCNIFGCDMSHLLGEHVEPHKRTHDIREELNGTMSAEALENILKSSDEKRKAPENFVALNTKKKPEEAPKEVFLVDIIEALASSESQGFIEFIAETVKAKHFIEDVKSREKYKFFKGFYDKAKINTKGIVNKDWETGETGENPLARESHIKNEYFMLIEDYCKEKEEKFTGKPWEYERLIDDTVALNYFRVLWAEDSLEIEKRYSAIAQKFLKIIQGLE